MDALGDSFFSVKGSGKENPNDNMDIYDRADFVSHMAVCSDLDGKEKADALAGSWRHRCHCTVFIHPAVEAVFMGNCGRSCRGCGMAGMWYLCRWMEIP